MGPMLPPQMTVKRKRVPPWLSRYFSKNGKKGGSVKSEAKSVARKLYWKKRRETAVTAAD